MKRFRQIHINNVVKHTEKRAKERYDVWFPSDISFLIKEIIDYRKNTKSTNDILMSKVKKYSGVMFLYRETKTSEKFHYLVEWRSKFYWAVWNSDLKTINTFLPLDGLKSKIGRMSNSTIGFLSSRNLIDVDEFKLMDVGKVTRQIARKEIINNDSLWSVSHNNQPTPHHSDHNQQ